MENCQMQNESNHTQATVIDSENPFRNRYCINTAIQSYYTWIIEFEMGFQSNCQLVDPNSYITENG